MGGYMLFKRVMGNLTVILPLYNSPKINSITNILKIY